jgi:hypothetical protein
MFDIDNGARCRAPQVRDRGDATLAGPLARTEVRR